MTKIFTHNSSLEEVTTNLSKYGSSCIILAGGTDVMIQNRRGEIDADRYLHIEQVVSLKGITIDDKIRIGAITSHKSIAKSDLINKFCPSLALASATIGSWQTQAAGTLGGNICNASPAADTIPALLIANAIISLQSLGKDRKVRLEDFILSRRKTQRLEDEIVTEICLEPLPENSFEQYCKVGPRSSMEVALSGVAVRITFNSFGDVSNAAIAVCAVGPKPFRSRSAEAELIGSKLDADDISNAASKLSDEIQPLDDFRASARYRKQVTQALLINILKEFKHQQEQKVVQ
jgi:carbon-monoxide dehydrogenase medium subunit